MPKEETERTGRNGDKRETAKREVVTAQGGERQGVVAIRGVNAAEMPHKYKGETNLNPTTLALEKLSILHPQVLLVGRKA